MLILNTAYFLDKKAIIVISFFFYIVFLCFSYYYFTPASLKISESSKQTITPKIHIIGKAAIGQYLWLHLLNGSLYISDNGFFQRGNITLSNIIFNYLSGPGYVQNSIPHDIEFLVLILNGRTSEHVIKAKQWLDFLSEIQSLKKVAVILLGNEQCENQWISSYLKSKGGIIDVLFIVYDAALIDNKEVFQWPLGVATYRGFPQLSINQIKYISTARKYKCNFIGTVYKNSSREIVNVTLRDRQLKSLCYLSTRAKWVPEESRKSHTEYLNVLQNSDFTLSPVGENTECYRIYEAVSLGSIPIIEDNMTPGVCVSPLRLLKKFKPPFIFVKNWENLHYLLQKDDFLNLKEIIKRRKKLLQWYDDFKKNIATNFVSTLKDSFFKINF